MKRHLGLISCFLLSVAALINLAACTADDGSTTGAQGGTSPGEVQTPTTQGTGFDDKNKLAFFFPLTGEQMQYGTMLKNGAELAVELWNEEHGTSYVAEFHDDKGDPKEAVNIANKIVADSTVIAGLGSYASSCAMAAAPVFEEKRLLLLSPAASHSDFPQMGDMMFSCVMSQKYEGVEYANEVWERTGLTRIAIIYQNTDHGVEASTRFKDQWEALGGEVVAYESYVPGQSNDFTPILSNIKTLEPEIIYASSAYNDAANIFLQARQLNIDCQLLGPAMLTTEDFLALVEDKIDGTMVLSTIPSFMPSVLENSDLSAETQKFIEEFQARYGKAPDGYASQGYDTVNILLGCIERAGTDSEDLATELAALRDFEGVSGFNMTFNENKEMIKGVYVFEIVDGDFVLMP